VKTLARERDKAELLQRLQQVRPDSPRRWGRMSAPQMVCHLGDAFRVALGQQVVTGPSGLLQRTMIKWIALYAPVRWPPDIPTSPEIDQLLICRVPGEFAADVAAVAALLERMVEPRPATWPPHPVFGSMGEAAWLRWGYLHTDHHLRQFGV
jgi:hypothetical protein